MIASPDGSRLFVTVGSNSNIGENGMENETRRAAILEIDPETTRSRVFASGGPPASRSTPTVRSSSPTMSVTRYGESRGGARTRVPDGLVTPGSHERGDCWKHSATFRCYAELNDFLPARRRHRSFEQDFRGHPSVKDTIEALGIPHTEVDLILVDGASVGFEHRLQGGERVSVYPVFERFDISAENRLRPRPLREPRFVLDVHLGRLARYLRLLGFDAAYSRDAADAVIASLAAAEKRIVLTRDVGLLKRSRIRRGYWVRATDPRVQLREVVRALDLASRIAPFTRCMACNGALEDIDERRVRHELPQGVRGRHATIARCRNCSRLYWPGSHFERLNELVRAAVGDGGSAPATA